MNKKLYFVLALVLAYVLPSFAQNPFVQTCYTTDPAPMVHDGRLYVYTGHDENGADFFWMQEWRVYSTDDMVNWVDHGSPLALESFAWADDRAWAPQAIERNGKFYFYVCAHSKISGGMAIGVAVGDSSPDALEAADIITVNCASHAVADLIYNRLDLIIQAYKKTH